MEFSWYGFIVGVAIATGLYLSEKVYVRRGGDTQDIERIVFPLLICALIGARLYHVIDYWDMYRNDYLLVFQIWNGGLGIWGAIGGVATGIYLFAKNKWDTASALVTALPLSQAMGRIANGVNGEFGELVGLFPWWSLEALGDALLFGLLWYISYKRVLPSTRVVSVYFIGYGILRAILEWGRDNVWTVGNIPTAVIVSAISVMIGLQIWRSNVRG